MPPADVLKDLQDRLTRLEAQLGDPPGADSLQPNVITVNPDGTIGANFTGHVHAQGLDLDAGTNNTPPTKDRVRWLRTSDGAAIADLAGYNSQGTVSGLVLSSYGTTDTPNSRSDLQAIAANGNLEAALTVFQNGPAGSSGIQVQAGDPFSPGGTSVATLLDYLGRSSFLQLLSAQKLKLQIGSGSVAVGLGASQFASIPLGTAWPNAHSFFAAGFQAQTTTAGVSLAAMIPSALDHGGLILNNTSQAQNFSYWYASLGN